MNLRPACDPPPSRIKTGTVIGNARLCRDHYRLTFRLAHFGPARPGQFVHLCPEQALDEAPYQSFDWNAGERPRATHAGFDMPMLRRAFSIAGLHAAASGAEIDVIYRVVGRATRWMQSLAGGDAVSVLGPLGNAFPLSPTKPRAWLVAGGVGLPPMLWLAQALHDASKQVIAFCGAQTAELLPLDLESTAPPARDASRAEFASREFAAVHARVVLSTDDGSLGFKGHVGNALTAYASANPPAASDLVVYTCGPEKMMRFVADYCTKHSIECYLCMERAMACGTGMCQSCVVPARDAANQGDWRYRLCCTEGPIFGAEQVLWDVPSRR
jgi:dihydroorotate dehydrogenase electron transfer subunit